MDVLDRSDRALASGNWAGNVTKHLPNFRPHQKRLAPRQTTPLFLLEVPNFKGPAAFSAAVPQRLFKSATNFTGFFFPLNGPIMPQNHLHNGSYETGTAHKTVGYRA